jgi:hypothetical protein
MEEMPANGLGCFRAREGLRNVLGYCRAMRSMTELPRAGVSGSITKACLTSQARPSARTVLG